MSTSNLSLGAIFTDLPENTVEARDFELEHDELYEHGNGSSEPIIAASIFDGPAEREEEVPEMMERPQDLVMTSVDDVIKVLIKEMESLGIRYRKEWSTVIQSQFHKNDFEMRQSHIQMFILGVLSERNLNIEKEIKDTSHNLAEEVNRLSGITKGLGEIKMQIHMEFDNKMKMMDQKMRDIEKILASADDTHSVSSKSSYPHDWNSLTKPVGTSSSTPKAARDYKALLLKLGFQEAHIKHPTMKKYQDQVVTPDMYDIVMGADAMSDDLREEFNQQILQGIKARQMAETSSIVRTSKPSSSAPVNKYDMEV